MSSSTIRRLAPIALLAILAAAPAGATVPGANGKILFQSDRSGNVDIYSMDADGANQTQLTIDPASDQQPTWSPDGQKIAFVSTRDGNPQIYVMNADGSSQTRLTTTSSADNSPAWSPDGLRIAFASDRTGNTDIFVMNADGSSPVRLTRNAAIDAAPDWSPDGSRIAFVSNRNGNGLLQIHLMNANGSHVSRLTNAGGNGAIHPSWSPDGLKIAFNSDASGNAEVSTINVDGTGEIQLTSGAQAAEVPVWSPDGAKIAFSHFDYVARDEEVAIMDADGTHETDLTGNPAGDVWSSWQALPSADLGITKSARPIVSAGSPFVYAIAVHNGGGSNAIGVVVTDTLPSQALLSSVRPSQGSCTTAGGGMTTVTCILGFLARGANATVQLTVKVRTPGIVTNTASVSSATSDPNPSNDSATVSTSIR